MAPALQLCYLWDIFLLGRLKSLYTTSLVRVMVLNSATSWGFPLQTTLLFHTSCNGFLRPAVLSVLLVVTSALPHFVWLWWLSEAAGEESAVPSLFYISGFQSQYPAGDIAKFACRLEMASSLWITSAAAFVYCCIPETENSLAVSWKLS